MPNNENINWIEIVNAYSSYEGRLINFCNINNISKNQFYYYRKKFKNESDVQFHEISIKEENSLKEITRVPSEPKDIRIEVVLAYAPENFFT